MNQRDKKYKELEKYWYEQLRKDGFNDIEENKTGHRYLKQWDFNFFRNDFNKVQYENKLYYYNAASELLLDYKFKNEWHKRIWELHSKGMSERDISKQIRKYKKSMVHHIISEIGSCIKWVRKTP